MPSTFPSMKRAGSIFIIFSALILVSTDALLLFPLSPVAGHSFVVTLNKNESLSPLSEFAFAFGESHSVPFTDCLLPDGATRFLTSCECALALAREPGFSVVHKGVPIVRNVTFVPGFFLPSRASLFQPLTLSLVTPVSGTKLCFNDSVVFLDYRPFDVLPSRRDAFERIGDALIPADSKNTVFACHNFMNKGIYRFSMMSTSVELHLNSTTKPPSVHFREDSIFPHCSGDFSLTWDLPSCPLPATTTTQFRIRVLAVLDTPPNTPEEWLYVEEIPVENTTGPSSTSIPCSQFDIVYRKFCFELVAVDDRSHRVAEWDRRCVFTEPLRRIDGNWTSWGKWSSCSVTCGSNGVRKRTRSCTNPAPSGGNFCIGSALEISNCTEPQPNCTTSDVIDRRQALLLRNGSSVPSCLCGCRVPDTLGVIHATRHHGCTNATLVWSFAPQHDSRVHLLVIANGNMRAQDYGLKVVKGLSGEIKWSSWQSSAHPIEVPLDEEVQIIFETKNISSRKSNSPRTGFFVDYRISTAPSEMFLLSHEYSAQLGLSWAFGHCSTPACQRAVIGVLLISIVFVIVILLAVPPLACSYATKKVLQNRRHDSTGSEALLTSLSQRLDAADNMYRSGGTNTTHLMSSSSGASSSHAQTGPESVFSIAKRSVGIQMSVQSTPRTTRSTRGPDGTLLGSLEELEYDFYDPVVPDSLLRPYVPSELDIDRIVEQETTGWYRPPVGGSVVDDDPDDRPGPSSSSF